MGEPRACALRALDLEPREEFEPIFVAQPGGSPPAVRIREDHTVRNSMKALVAITLGLISVASCSGPKDEGGGSAGAAGDSGIVQAKSSLPRNTAPSVSSADAQALSDGNASFALDLYKQLAAEPGNVFCSPHSVSIALAMLHAGARSTTETEMAQALHFSLPQLSLHPAMNSLALALAARSEDADAAEGEGFRLNVENSLWSDKTTTLVPGFLDLLAENYGAGLSLVDFMHDSEGARVKINDWVDDATSGKIPELLLRGDVSAGTRLVLTNAIHFKAAWRNPFQPSQTMTGTFHAAGGDVSVPMMRGGSELLYAETPEFQAIELPYQGGKVGMTLVLPAQGKLAQVEAALSLTWLKALDASATTQRVAITMPKFTVMQRYELDVALKALGMKQAFEASADFSGQSPERLFVSWVIHQAFVSVDEKGTEAAAASAVLLDGGGVPATPKSFTLDRPFLFFVRDYPTNAILFAGRVVNPS